MDKLELLFEMKMKSNRLESKLMSHDATEIEDAKLELKELAAHFHQEYERFMSQSQYEWAKDDIHYFTFLLEEAVAYYKSMIVHGDVTP